MCLNFRIQRRRPNELHLARASVGSHLPLNKSERMWNWLMSKLSPLTILVDVSYCMRSKLDV